MGIIGTAGRGPDGDAFKANPGLYRTMKAVAQIMVTVLKPSRLVSGGAAYADQLAVQLYLDGEVPNLTLHLPAEWTGHGFRETSSRYDTGRTSNYWHGQFSATQSIDSLHEIQLAIEKGAVVFTGAGGFKERNTDIVMDADVLLAFTFGRGAKLKGEDEVPRRGGTLDSWDKYLVRRANLMATSCAATLEGYPDILPAYHYDLTTKRLFSL